MPIQTLSPSASGAYAGSGDSNNTKANANFQEIGNQEVVTMAVAPGAATALLFSRNGAKTVTKIEGRKFGSWTTGGYSLTIGNGTASTLMSATPYDPKAGLVANDWTEIALSATPANLIVADGTPIMCALSSDSGGANANDALLLRFTFAD